MPSLEHLIASPARREDGQVQPEPDLLEAFGKARSNEGAEPPDLFAAFSRAARDREERESEKGLAL